MNAALPTETDATPLVALYRQMWRHAEGARASMALALAMLGSSQLLKLAVPWLAAQAINSIQTGGQRGLPAAGAWIATALGLHLGVWLLHGPARVIERGVALRVRRSVADSLYVRLAHAPLTWHDAHHSGDLQHRIGQASAALCDFTQRQFIYLQNAINLIGPLVALWWLSAPTGVIALAGFVAIGLAVMRFDGALMKLAARENQAERRYAARLLDFVGNISAVASLRLQDATRRLLDARLLVVFEPLRRSIVLNEWKWCAVDLLSVALSWGLVVHYAWSVGSAAGGTVLIGSLFMTWQYAQQAAGVLGSLAANYQGLARTQTDYGSAEPIRQAPEPRPASVRPDADWRSLELHHLDFSHASTSERGARGGLHDVSLALRRGERVALVGPSGSGKSTLLRVLAGLYGAQQGHVSIDGVALLGRRDVGELSTLIPQEAEIFESSLRGNITLEQIVEEPALQTALRASALDEVLAQLPQGLDTPVSERGFNLSGGQRQRLALARGVLAAQGRSLLLLDEPTSALDALTEQRVHRRLDEAFPDACIVAAVHRLSLLAHFDRVVLMVGGRIVDSGSVDELSERQPLFAAMCRGVEPAPVASTEGTREPAMA